MKRQRTAQEKKLADDARLLRAWKKFHREERETVLAGPHGVVLAELFRMFKNLQHVRPAQLIGFAAAIDWVVIDYNTKLTVLHEINAAITRFREKRGLEPIDDGAGAPGEPETPYRQLKAILFPPNGAPAEAQLGPNIETPSKTGHCHG
jgi:hypothetical protein